MLMDLRESSSPTTLVTDICIIGAGAAGISLAAKLYEAGNEVLLVEAGGREVAQSEQNIIQGSSVGRPLALNEGRVRVLGGTTSRWRGRCAELSEIDLEKRSWVARSGWPISFEELQYYHEETAKHCGFNEPWRPDSSIYGPRLGGHFQNKFAPVQPFVWRFAPTGRAAYQNWATRFARALKPASGIKVLLHANVAAITPSAANNHVKAIEVRTLEGRSAQIRAREFVLACGGVENARITLNFASDAPALFSKVQDSLGRYFMQHPKVTTGAIQIRPGMEIELQRMINLFLRPRGTQYEIGFCLSPIVQRSLELVNCSAHVRYEPGEHTGWKHVKSLLAPGSDTQFSKELVAIARDPRRVVENGWRRAWGRSSLYPSPIASLVVELEQLPDPDSRIFLQAPRDCVGLRRAAADWRISDLECRTALQFSQLIDKLFRQAGWGSVRIDQELEQCGIITDKALQESYHHIGSTRMSESGKDGVVNRNCTVHGIDNLHLVGASVMPTGGHVNPTFTIVSLALRLADHLERRGGR